MKLYRIKKENHESDQLGLSYGNRNYNKIGRKCSKLDTRVQKPDTCFKIEP